MKNTVKDGICEQCGRDYRSGDEDEIINGDCLEVDECPAYFEAEGIPHPNYPEEFEKFKAAMNEIGQTTSVA